MWASAASGARSSPAWSGSDARAGALYPQEGYPLGAVGDGCCHPVDAQGCHDRRSAPASWVWAAKSSARSGKARAAREGGSTVSRVGRIAVAVPAGVQIDVKGLRVNVKGPKGELERTFVPPVIHCDGRCSVVVTRPSDAPTGARPAWHDPRPDQNMVTGVQHRLYQGAGSRWRGLPGRNERQELLCGVFAPGAVDPPDGISFDVDTKTSQIKISGIDKELVGQVAADMRKFARPSPTRARACATGVSRSAARLVRLARSS